MYNNTPALHSRYPPLVGTAVSTGHERLPRTRGERERERTFHVETGEVERPKIRGRQGPRNDETRIIKRFFLLHSRE